MRRLSLSHLLLVTATVPVAVMLALLGVLSLQSWQTYRDVEAASKLGRVASAASDYFMATPPEAIEGVTFLQTGDEKAAATFRERARVVDETYRKFMDAVAAAGISDPIVADALRFIKDHMQQLQQVRRDIEARTFAPQNIVVFYQPMSGQTIEIVGRLASIVDHSELSRLTSGLYASLHGMDGALIESTQAHIWLKSGRMPQANLLMVAHGAELAKIFARQYENFAPKNLAERAMTFDRQNSADIEQLRNKLLANDGTPASAEQIATAQRLEATRIKLWTDLVASTRRALTQRIDELGAAAWSSLVIYSVTALGSLALVMVLSQLAIGCIRGLLRELTGAMTAIADQDLGTSVPLVERKDEIGLMASAVAVFRRNAIAARAFEDEEIARKAGTAAERQSAMNHLAASFESEVMGIVDAVGAAAMRLETAATTLTQTAGATQGLAASAATASSAASSNVQSVAIASEELARSVGEIARQVQESSRIAVEAVSQARQTDVRIGELSQAAGRIGDVVKLITAIAEQTNLLALNATIEAARAGEAGKGFAIVAQEVKTLAAQTAKATGDIGAQVAGMQGATANSVSAIKQIGSTINRIADIAAVIATAVEQQGAATQEISANVQQAARGTDQAASNIAELNHGAGETESASTQVLSSARSLSTDGTRLKREVDKFLASVRAGR